MKDNIFGFIGLGLIGGSIARCIRKASPDCRIIAYTPSGHSSRQALAEGTIDEACDSLGPAFAECDLIFLCAPVEYNIRYLSEIRHYLKPGALLTDIGSTKSDIHREVNRLGMEEVFIGSHPMAGSEKTGFESSSERLLENAYYIITPTGKSKKEDIDRLMEVAAAVRSLPIILDPDEHDRAVAAISHLPHLIASGLVNLVRTHDSEEGLMKRLAAGGFKDITRIASSSPEMWEQICMTNSANVAGMLDDYIASLQELSRALKRQDGPYIRQMFADSRSYRDSFSDKPKGSVIPEYSFTVDIADEIGAISTLSVILAAKGISIKNIGINHNREHGEGALRIEFYTREAMELAWERLLYYRYDLMH